MQWARAYEAVVAAAKTGAAAAGAAAAGAAAATAGVSGTAGLAPHCPCAATCVPRECIHSVNTLR